MVTMVFIPWPMVHGVIHTAGITSFLMTIRNATANHLVQTPVAMFFTWHPHLPVSTYKHTLTFVYLPVVIHIMSDLHLYAPTCGIHHICMAFTVNFKSFLLLNELAREILISLEIWYEYIGFDLNKFQYPSAVKPLSWCSTRKAPNISRCPTRQASHYWHTNQSQIPATIDCKNSDHNTMMQPIVLIQPTYCYAQRIVVLTCWWQCTLPSTDKNRTIEQKTKIFQFQTSFSWAAPPFLFIISQISHKTRQTGKITQSHSRVFSSVYANSCYLLCFSI